MSNLIVGNVYTVKHARKGVFTAKLLRDGDDGDFVQLELTDGKPEMMNKSNEIEHGEIFEVRKDFCTFEPA